MRVSLPVALSLAVTLRMPLASMSNVTSTCGTPRGAGGIPSRWKRPRLRVAFAGPRSPPPGRGSERERGDVEQQDVLHLAAEHRRLDGRSDRHHLIGVHRAVRLLA